MSCAALARKTQSAEATKRSSSLRVGEPNDTFEQEADRVADRVMGGAGRPWSIARMNTGPSVQRTCSCGGSGECQECKKKLQRKAASSAPAHATPNTDRVLQSPGRPLDRATRAFMEPRFGHDFSRVRIHHDGEAAQSASELHAKAYTVGNHIAFAAGNFQPSTRAGGTLLAHELTHVVQQNGAMAAVQRSPDDDDAPEPTRPRSVDLLSLRPEDMCGPGGCYKGDQQYDEYKKKQEEREELDRRIRATPIEQRISTAVNHLYVWQYKLGNHDGLWDPPGEEVWAYGYYQENDERRQLFTEDEKFLVIEIRNGYLAAKLARAADELKREKERAEWARQDAMEAQFQQIISPAPFVEGVAFSAINPYLGAAVMGTQTGMMVGEAYNACRSGPSLDCADKVVPIIGAVAMEGLMGGEPVGSKRKGAAPEPNTGPRPALGSKDPAFWKETAPTGKNPAAHLEPGKSPVTDILAARKPAAKPVTDSPRPAGGAAANENVAPPKPVANENVVPQELRKTGTTGDSDIVASRKSPKPDNGSKGNTPDPSKRRTPAAPGGGPAGGAGPQARPGGAINLKTAAGRIHGVDQYRGGQTVLTAELELPSGEIERVAVPNSTIKGGGWRDLQREEAVRQGFKPLDPSDLHSDIHAEANLEIYRRATGARVVRWAISRGKGGISIVCESCQTYTDTWGPQVR